MVKALVFLSILFKLLFPNLILGDSRPHYTLIINQVRGQECCDKGSVENLKNQLDALDQLQLSANFAVRYDALIDENFSALLQQQKRSLLGGLLEITPGLAHAAGVNYKGTEDSWYEAQNIFLIGYSLDERQRLIDAFMNKFKTYFGEYPSFTTAWMIDARSLKYLKETYGVVLHQITREQFGTDSYTLYGGPIHYPYWPSENWALIPSKQSLSMPLIVRQTIMDPVYSYGDTSNSYTSQPNDYFSRGVNIEYFKHLFLQAHNQKQDYTFALIGLENSMGEEFQKEYVEQLAIVKDWLGQGEQNVLVAPSALVNFLKTQKDNFSVYDGKSQNAPNEQAFWITTDNYRTRVRLSEGKLFISDLRLYSSDFKDPYLDKSAGLLGWWIVPFVLDGSRYFLQQDSKLIQNLRNDYLKGRDMNYSIPTNITIAEQISPEEFQVEKSDSSLTLRIKRQVIARFEKGRFYLAKSESKLANSATNYILRSLQYYSKEGNALWGFEAKDGFYYPFVLGDSLNKERQDRPALNFPQLEDRVLDIKLSELFVNNKYALVGRNPVRLILFPRDQDGNPVLISAKPKVESTKALGSISIIKPNSANGMIFIDLTNNQPLQAEILLTINGFESKTKVYFAPDCKKTLIYCFTHPVQAWWYVRTKFDDLGRERSRQQTLEEKFIPSKKLRL